MNTVKTGQLLDELVEVGKLYQQETALSDGERQISYGELYSLATRLACGICRYYSTLSDDDTPRRVGICLGQSAGSIAGILAVMLSGNIYVPLEMNLPDQRLRDVIDDAGVSMILVNREFKAKAAMLTFGRDVYLFDIDHVEPVSEDFVLPVVSADSPAYIMYTSGSTGKPKGVIQTHQNILFFAGAFGNMLKVTNADRTALTTSLSHTVSVIDVFSHLLKGACIVVYDLKKEKDLSRLLKLFVSDEITIFHSIPNLFRVLFNGSVPNVASLKIRLVILGGEDIRVKDFDLYRAVFNDKVVMVNLYGSSELIIAFAQLLNKKSVISRERIPIGFPVKGVEYEVRGETGAKCGVLGVGELLFKSPYLSPGYWRLPSTAIGRDVMNPDITVYHSGDQGRILPSGAVEFMGRADSQVKINGNRIELQEVEIILEKAEGISKSIVKTFTRRNGEHFIGCFYKANGNDPGHIFLRAHLQHYLLDFMIPERFICVESFPLTETGKIDRKALDISVFQQQPLETDINKYTANQKQVANIWKEVLGHDQFTLGDKFFEVGGNSLKLIELYTTLNTHFPGELSVQMIFENQTVQGMAAVMNSKVRQETAEREVVEDIDL